MFNNEIILEIAKKLENDTNIPNDSKLHNAITSKEIALERFIRNKQNIEVKLARRLSLNELISKNIYKTEYQKDRFNEIQKRIKDLFMTNKKCKTPYSAIKISSKLACRAKIIEFQLKRQKLSRLKGFSEFKKK
ncbi:hypothetical protein H312_01175 [Anncaliia algerae PRA339]|uniref:Uncharacterized protein n=1 Tax=Anncaliia algerae PRA339 TaxID=1288291 RepID=A0A059F2J9_9MICR|nr:hypothetical protein H312_01175 [Anncaliia algerae PRA339]